MGSSPSQISKISARFGLLQQPSTVKNLRCFCWIAESNLDPIQWIKIFNGRKKSFVIVASTSIFWIRSICLFLQNQIWFFQAIDIFLKPKFVFSDISWSHFKILIFFHSVKKTQTFAQRRLGFGQRRIYRKSNRSNYSYNRSFDIRPKLTLPYQTLVSILTFSVPSLRGPARPLCHATEGLEKIQESIKRSG